MAVRRILQLGDPFLRKKSRNVADASHARETLENLRDTLHEFQSKHGFGRGISAVQIGSLERVIYIEFKGSPYCLINPEIEYESPEKFRLWDDCFSFPDLLVHLERSESIRLRYLDDAGEHRQVDASGPLSELLQHEMDHLDGVLAIDRAIDRNSFCTREEYLRSVKL